MSASPHCEALYDGRIVNGSLPRVAGERLLDGCHVAAVLTKLKPAIRASISDWSEAGLF
jgi:hypothetical protein